MDVLRCKTPEMIRKEIGVHLLAYNLIRTVIAQSASLFGILPRKISFKGTVQTVRVENQSGRSEPRAVKRRPKAHPRLTVPRRQAV